MLDTQKELNLTKPQDSVTECEGRYERYEKLGEGTYGVVYRALDKKTGKIVAIKKIRLEHVEEGMPSTAIREIAILREVDHESLVNLIDIYHGDNKLYLIFEYAQHDVRKFLEKKGVFSPVNVKKVLKQLLEGILYCHQRRIMHRDLKPSNILINQEYDIKVADFGLARTFGLPLKTYTHEVVTLWYRAPEIILGQKIYSTAVDVWSIGCIFYEIAHKKPLFYGDSEIGQIFKIFRTMGTPNDQSWQGIMDLPEMKGTFPKWKPRELAKLCPNFDEQAIDLLEKMVQLEPSKRISAKEALNHPYFTSSPSKQSHGSSMSIENKENMNSNIL